MDQDIIEKKPSSPLGTSLLAITACCMLGAMIVCGMELHELKSGDVAAQSSATKFSTSKYKKYQDVVDKMPKPETDG